MNIFYLSHNPTMCARYHTDKHVVKMILETAQLLSTAHRILDGHQTIEIQNNRKLKRWTLDDNKENILYKATHVNHPCAVWARASSSNYEWLYTLFHELCREFQYRYGKIHLSWTKLNKELAIMPKNICLDVFTPPALAMPEQYKTPAAIFSYKNYYKHEKQHLHKWTKREIPYFICD